MARTKKVFISDIHMGDARSMEGSKPYCWLKKNIPVLARFLKDQLESSDVKEVVLLGDLFDEWVIPVNDSPLTSYADICANPANESVIDKLKALAASPDIKLSYVPGNHDMAMNHSDIGADKAFLENEFPGIRYICQRNVPLGTYNVGTIAAEHGDRYCLFNAPDTWTAQDAFLPLGYFISRMVAYKVSQTGKPEDYVDILGAFLKNLINKPELVNDLILAIAKDADLEPTSTFDMSGVPGFADDLISVNDVIQRYKHLPKNWKNTPGNINLPTAIISDVGNLALAAELAYFRKAPSNTNIVVFGHTHKPTMDKNLIHEFDPESGEMEPDIPCESIYVNSGAWVDSVEKCSYVETEEMPASNRHCVRLKSYPGNRIINDGFVEM